MKYIFTLILTFTISGAFAQTADQQKVSDMLDHMVKSKMITQDEADKAKLKMLKMSAEQWAALNKEANAKAQAEIESQQKSGRTPASVDSEEGVGDLEGAQLQQIQTDMHNMLPRQ